MKKASTPRSPRGRNRSTSVPSAEEQPTQKTAKRDWAAYKRKQRSDRFAELVAQFREAGHLKWKAKQLARDRIAEDARLERRRLRLMKRFPILYVEEDGSFRFDRDRVRYSSAEEIKETLDFDVSPDLPTKPLSCEPYTLYYSVSALRRLATGIPLGLLSRQEAAAYAMYAIWSLDSFFGEPFRDPRLASFQRQAWELCKAMHHAMDDQPQLVVQWTASFGLLPSVLELANSNDATNPIIRNLGAHWAVFGSHVLWTQTFYLRAFWVSVTSMRDCFLDRGKRYEIVVGEDDSSESPGDVDKGAAPGSELDRVRKAFFEWADDIERMARKDGVFLEPPEAEVIAPVVAINSDPDAEFLYPHLPPPLFPTEATPEPQLELFAARSKNGETPTPHSQVEIPRRKEDRRLK